MDTPLTEIGDGLGLPLLSAIAARRRFSDTACEVLPYEQALDRDPEWALRQGSRHFEETSAVFLVLHKITGQLAELNIPYAIVGDIALFRHGLRRFTEVVEILVTGENLQMIHKKLVGLGYRPPHKHSKHLRDSEFGVRIEFLTTADYPGDGKPKPVAFPDPSRIGFEVEGIHYIELERLIELKVAAGMSNEDRMQDLADVLALITNRNLTLEFGERLHPYVRDKFQELWKWSQIRYVKSWKPLAANATTLLDAMLKDGVVLEDAAKPDGSPRLVTTDPEIARKYDMLDESEFWDDDRGPAHQ